VCGDEPGNADGDHGVIIGDDEFDRHVSRLLLLTLVRLAVKFPVRENAMRRKTL
jgi:hypothetical protein